MEENLIKKTCKELGLTYRELGEAIGYSEGTLKTIASTGNISENLLKSISLLKANRDLERRLQEVEELKSILKKLLNIQS